VIEVVGTTAESQRYADALATLRRMHADDDQVDPHSTLEQLPTADDLLSAFGATEIALVAHAASGEMAGYGMVRSWLEDDGTAVHLLDAWAVPGASRTGTLTELFTRLEAFVRDRGSPAPGAVLGANSRSTDQVRAALLTRLGFDCAFSMVEMQLTAGRPDPAALPPTVALRTMTPEDASAITGLTQRVWADRPFFTMPDLDETRQWLNQADPELFLLAEYDSHLIGLASAEIAARCAEIDDVQVDPSWQRRGVATALVSELLIRLSDRTEQPVRLHTEAHDPAGARSLYERLGFVVVTTHDRYRKQFG
jgi:mycothiol synthase